ncbi:Clan CA, family C19, ubiquitin hydrolase-like cysteine peptidase [Histomonas meleagridis]|uniref:Clan CA, family C19, ubiquitin hydrolase-like cysteine peptidase n=1 Tax=Histomonas meleagridis TaxID=135588 RepID=UPI003559CBD6|nr:Clan CA, family C19, ubiquitin hydrolase-like cysteine peptidase [Histomonas meleagridis]KAH0802599.1 Clan CA, family C19, ubiquitin hydrolase-like cysteine peptidase [Histomonas meleagridis]
MAAEVHRIPQPKEQYTQYKKLLKQSPLKPGENAYIISTEWLNKWKNDVSGDIDIDMSCGQIDNSALLKDGKFDFKQYHERLDYEIISKPIWELFYSWYGGGPVIPVNVVEYKGTSVAVVSRLTFIIVYHQQKIGIETNKYEKISSLREKALKLFNLPEDTQSRLVDIYSNNNAHLKSFSEFLNDNDMIIDTKLYDHQTILLDTKGEDGIWDFEKTDSTIVSRSASAGAYPEMCNCNKPAIAPGIVGFGNFGKTCFFNAGVQCLIHTNPLKKIFLNDDWEKDLNTTNPIGMKGKLACAFGKLFKEVWSGKNAIIAPRELKQVVGEYAPMFRESNEQDCQELITIMLDGIHEDLNRCADKPVTETVNGDGTNDDEISKKSWAIYKKRNDSIIVDTFYGQLRSVINCPNCHSKTVVFDPYNILNLPISKPHQIKLNVTYFPYDFREKHIKLVITVPTCPKMSDFSKVISEAIGKEVNVVVGLKGYGKAMTWGYNSDNSVQYYRPIYYAFEIPSTDKLYVPCCVYMIKNSGGFYSQDIEVAGPILVPVNSTTDYEKEISISVRERLSCVWQPPEGVEETTEIKKLIEEIQLPTEDFEGKEIIVKIVKGYYETENELKPDKNFNYLTNKIATLEFTAKAVQPEKGFSLLSLVRHYEVNSRNPQNGNDQITLNTCFDYFTTEETLDEDNKWYCPQCHEFVCAIKKMDIWSIPKVLIISLKRFVCGEVSSKLETYVDYPDVFDLSDYVMGPHEKSLKYRLYAVSEHDGSKLSAGHYKAHCIVSQGDHACKGDNWYCFNDSTVTSESAKMVHTSKGYVLFYERIDE